MMLEQQVYAQALLLAGELAEKRKRLLKLLCGVTSRALAARLREGLRPEDIRGDFVAAASLYALAALMDADGEKDIQELKAGDLTVKQGGASREAAARSLQKQADRLIRAYLRDGFRFMGV